MTYVDIQTEDGEIYEMKLPLSVTEIKFADWCDFKQAENAMFDEQKKAKEGEDTAIATEEMLFLAVAKICGDAVMHLPLSINDESATKLFEENLVLELDMELSLIRVYCHICNIINGYQPAKIPNTMRLRHRGKKFELSRLRSARILSEKPLTTGEAIEVLEYQRRTAELLKADPKGIGNLEFTLGLTEFALLVRQKNERLPADPGERDRFVTERRELFRDLPLSTVLDLRFFFQAALTELSLKVNTGSSLKARRTHTKIKRGGKRGRPKMLPIRKRGK